MMRIFSTRGKKVEGRVWGTATCSYGLIYGKCSFLTNLIFFYTPLSPFSIAMHFIGLKETRPIVLCQTCRKLSSDNLSTFEMDGLQNTNLKFCFIHDLTSQLH